jgi:hypothetical protein
MGTWGDCYQRNPKYVPASSDSLVSFIYPDVDPEVQGKTVEELYEFLALMSPAAKTATCRNWLMENQNKWRIDTGKKRVDLSGDASKENDHSLEGHGALKSGYNGNGKFALRAEKEELGDAKR